MYIKPHGYWQWFWKTRYATDYLWQADQSFLNKEDIDTNEIFLVMQNNFQEMYALMLSTQSKMLENQSGRLVIVVLWFMLNNALQHSVGGFESIQF